MRVACALVSLGYGGKFTPHGFRATASAMLNELGYRPDIIERQLAHKERNATRASYNQAEYLEARQGMMQGWADLLEGRRKGTAGKVSEGCLIGGKRRNRDTQTRCSPDQAQYNV
jgi:integrase